MKFVHDDSYSKVYDVYIELSDQHRANIACLQQHIPNALGKLEVEEEKGKFNMLSIGSADGLIDQEILKIVEGSNANNQVKRIEARNTAVEPNPVFLKTYKEIIESQSKPKGWSSKFDLKLMSYEEYEKSKHEMNQYHMIHAIHTLYFMDCLESVLKHLYCNELGDTGLIACILADESNLSAIIASMLNKNRSKNKKVDLRLSSDAVSIAEKFKWKYQKVVIPFTVDVTEIFEESPRGHCLLEFLVHEEGFKFQETATEEELRDVLALLKDVSTRNDNGRLIAKSSNELIFIYKTS